jgi:hypothetical protein
LGVDVGGVRGSALPVVGVVVAFGVVGVAGDVFGGVVGVGDVLGAVGGDGVDEPTGGVVVPVSVLVVDVAGPAGSGSAAAATDVSPTAISAAAVL